MLTYEQRVDRYTAQTGRTELTPRQRRRAGRKWLHQSWEAIDRRAQAAAARAKARQVVKDRRASR